MILHRLLLLLTLVAPLLLAAAERPKPNVVLVITDDQGYGDLACHGNRMIRTPNLDRLHAESVRFTNFHVDPTCSPTRSALLTGRYSTRVGVWHTIMGRSLLYADEVTLADAFRASGYRTGIIGKWHLGDNYPFRPQDRGFEETLVLGGGGIGQTPDFWGNDYFDDTFLRNGRPEAFQGYCTDVFFAEALRFVERHRKQPFFLYLATNVPHGPYRVPERYSRFYADQGVPQPMASFYGMIENFDENLGRLRARLQALKLEDNTLFIFMTDNGTAAGVTGPRQSRAGTNAPSWEGFNAGMRGQKGSEYEGGHRVPCFIRWPAGGLGAGSDVDRLTAHLDLMPTLVELCGLKLPRPVAFDGRSLVPLLTGAAPNWPERTLFVSVQREEIPPKWTRSAVMTERWRLVNGRELYHAPSDPGQRNDVAAQHADAVENLRKAYETWWRDMAPSIERYGYIVLGSKAEPVTVLNAMDWHAPLVKDIPWDQTQVKAAPWSNGHWMVEVAKAGRYEFTLRQQPEAAKFPVQATRARVRAGDTETEAPVPGGSTGVKLRLDLKPGPMPLQTWLVDEPGNRSRGAFYVEVRKL